MAKQCIVYLIYKIAKGYRRTGTHLAVSWAKAEGARVVPTVALLFTFGILLFISEAAARNEDAQRWAPPLPTLMHFMNDVIIIFTKLGFVFHVTLQSALCNGCGTDCH